MSKYKNSAGEPCTLSGLVTMEPQWAVNRIETLQRERDEARRDVAAHEAGREYDAATMREYEAEIERLRAVLSVAIEEAPHDYECSIHPDEPTEPFYDRVMASNKVMLLSLNDIRACVRLLEARRTERGRRMTPDEQCARILGREYLTHVQPKFGDAIPVRLEYGSDETLIGEMLAAFDRFKAENEIAEWELFTASIHDAPHGFTYWDDDGQHDFFAKNKCEAVRAALIQASEVQDET